MRAQSRGDEAVALFAVFECHAAGQPHRLAPLDAREDHLAGEIAAIGQVAAEDDLLRAQRQVGQFFGIHPRGPQAAELDLHVAQGRLGHFGQQLAGHGDRAARAGHLADRAAAQGGNGLQHQRLEAAARGHGVERPGVPFGQPPQPLGEGHRVAVAGGRDAVADVDHLGAGPTTPQRRGHGLIQIGPAQRNPPGEELPRGGDRLGLRGTGPLEGPIAIHVAGGQVDLVLGRQRADKAATNSAWAARLAASIEAEVSATMSSSMGSPLGSTSRRHWPLGPGGVNCTIK